MLFLGPLLIIWVMVKFPRLTVTLAAAGVTGLLLVQHPFFGYVVLALELITLVTVLRIREQDDNAREAINLQRRVESDLDRRDRHLEADRVGRAQMQAHANMVAVALIREARRVR